MNIPFLNLFQKVRERFRSVASTSTSVVRAVPVEKKPTSERLSKTVMPNSTRTMTARDLVDATGGSAPRPPAGSTSRNPAGASRMPPAIALALVPKVERTISLQLSDILSEIPSGYAKPADSLEPSRRILLKASEIEKGMATGKPTVSLAAVYEQIPEIFLRSVPSSELMHLPLPYDKVLEQFSSARVRDDQERDQNVPQVETPILQVTLEDTARFGTAMEPLQASSLPPVKVETASASTLAAAEPESAVRETTPPSRVRSTIPLDVAMSPKPEPTGIDPAKPSQPTRIPFKLPPNGTGESASESVPASSGPPVPTRPPPTRNPFKSSPPSDALRPKKTLVPGKEPAEPAEDLSAQQKSNPPNDIKIAIPLRLILQSIPPFQLTGDPTIVPEDQRIEFPFSLIQSQLVTGRVAIAPRVFQDAMPVNYRELLIVDEGGMPILLPLQEVLKNIPDAALQVRPDQEQIDAGEIIETPFSIKAREDAERFKTAPTPMAKAVEPTPAPIQTAAKPNDKIDIDKVEPAAEASPTEKKVDAKEVAARVAALDGINGCSITFADGLILAGNFPNEFAVEGLCAVAPSLLQRIEKHMVDSKLGGLKAMTLHGEKAALTFFMSGDICLTALHAAAELAPDTQRQLTDMAKELSQIYAQPEPINVDH